MVCAQRFTQVMGLSWSWGETSRPSGACLQQGIYWTSTVTLECNLTLMHSQTHFLSLSAAYPHYFPWPTCPCPVPALYAHKPNNSGGWFADWNFHKCFAFTADDCGVRNVHKCLWDHALDLILPSLWLMGAKVTWTAAGTGLFNGNKPGNTVQNSVALQNWMRLTTPL